MDCLTYKDFCQYPACSVKASYICRDCPSRLFVCDAHGRGHRENTKHQNFQDAFTDITPTKMIEVSQDFQQTILAITKFKEQAIKKASDIIKGLKNQLNMLLKNLYVFERYIKTQILALNNSSKVDFFTMETLNLLKIQKNLIFPTRIIDYCHPFDEMLLSLQSFSIPVLYAEPQNFTYPSIFSHFPHDNLRNTIISNNYTLPQSISNFSMKQSNVSCATIPFCSSPLYTPQIGSPNSFPMNRPNLMAWNETITCRLNQRVQNPNEKLPTKVNSYIRSYCFDCHNCEDINDYCFNCCGKSRCSICKKEVHEGQTCHKANSKFLEEKIECPKCGDSAKRNGYTVKINCPTCNIYCIVCLGSLKTHKFCDNLYFSNFVR